MALKEQDTQLSLFARSIRGVDQLSENIGPTSPAMTTSSSSQQNGSQQTTSKSTQSAAGSPVKTCQMQAVAPDLPARVQDSGGRWLEPFAWYDRSSSSWRTWQSCLIEGWAKFSEIWPRSAMTRSGVAYRPATSEPRNCATESGLLPTLSAREGKDWSQAKILARLDNGGCVARRICSASQRLRSSAQVVGLNPCFAEWMMGYPETWTDLEG